MTLPMVWLNGALLAQAQARIDPGDRGFALGDGLFETIRVAGGAAPLIERHLARLRNGAATLGIPLALTDTALMEAVAAVIAANAVADGSCRLTLTRGPAPRGVLPPQVTRPTMLITAAAGVAPASSLTLVIATVTRRNQASPLSQIKSLNYLDGILARQEAAARGAEDALLLNTLGQVAESTIATLLVLREGRLLTPPVADGALPGITRALLIERAGVAEASLVPEQLRQAEAAYLCSSLSLRAVAGIDGQALPDRPDLLRHLHGKAFP